MKLSHYKRVNSFPHLLKRLLNETRIWDSVMVTTNVDAILPQTFTDGVTEYYLTINVYYTDEDGESAATGFLYQTSHWDWLMDMERQARSLIAPIFD